jgi:glycine dehydrogenase subunit 1
VALMALASTIYLALMGRDGLSNVAKLSYSRAHLLHDKLRECGLKTLNKTPFYNEFIMNAPKGSSEKILSNLLKNGILGGLNLAEDKILICCTEMNTVQDIESYVSIIKETTIIK